MKNSIIAGAFALMGILLFSCTKEIDSPADNQSSVNSGTITATATIPGQDTKTTYTSSGAGNSISVNWSASETFTAYDSSTSHTFTKSVSEEAQTATFTCSDEISNGTNLLAVYDKGSRFTKASSTISLANAYVTADNIANLKDIDVMTASGTVADGSVNFTFEHMCAFIRVTLKRGTNAAGNNDDTHVTLHLKNCAPVSNGYTYTGWTHENNILTTNLTLDSALASGEERVLYVAIPPVTYAASESAVPSSDASYTKTYSLSSGKTLAAGEVYDIALPYNPDHMTANFGTKGSNCSYNASQYYWVSNSDNMMKVFTFASGELKNYNKLSFEFSNNNSGAYGVRCGYYVGESYTGFNSGNAYFTAGTKDIDLTTLGVDLSTVTAIAFGGNGGGSATVPGYCEINEAGFVLTGTGVDPLTATFTKPGTKACNHTFSWSSTTDNLMYCFTFANGELAQYSSLNFNLNRLISTTASPQIRINFVYEGGNMNITSDGKDKTFTSDGTKTITMEKVSEALATVSKTLKDVTTIRIGGANTTTGACGIVANDMYLTK